MISVIHPSRFRSDQAQRTCEKWLAKADRPNDIEYLLALDNSDLQLKKYEGWAKKVKVVKGHNRSAIQAINRAAKETIGNLLIIISDDFEAKIGWDTALLEALDGKEDYCVKTIDGIQDWIITLPIMDRIYYERFGYIYEGSYRHLWSDSEMSCVAWMLGRYIKLDLTFPHHHYSTGKTRKDEINQKNDSTWRSGERTFYERAKRNFDLKDEDIKQSFPFFAGFKPF